VNNANNKAFEERGLKEIADGKVHSLKEEMEILSEYNQKMKGDMGNLERKLKEANDRIEELEMRLRESNSRPSVSRDDGKISDLESKIKSLKRKMASDKNQSDLDLGNKKDEINRLKLKLGDLEA